MKRLTHRQYLVSLAWLKKQWNNPSRSDYLLMRIAQRVQQVLAGKEAKNITLEDQKVRIDFVTKKSPKKLTLKQKAKIGMSRWRGMLGMGRKNG